MKRRTFTAVGLLLLAGCAQNGPGDSTTSADAGGGDGASDGGFTPAAIKHAFGTTQISAKPAKVVTLGWGSAEACLAMEVTPVGMETQTYGVDKDGQLPWVAEELEKLGTTTTLIPATVEEPAYEDIDKLSPDLILAPYSGITKEQYSLLSEIAPTVAYPDKAWTTPWRTVITMVGQALGIPEKAEDLLTSLNGELNKAAEAHPELQGVTMAAVWDVGGTFWVYKADDARVEFLEDLGLKTSASVAELDTGGETFTYSLSYEQTDRLESDILVDYASTKKEAAAFLQKPYAKAIPAVGEGAVAQIVGDKLIAAMSPPTALSLTWGLNEYVDILAGAVKKVA